MLSRIVAPEDVICWDNKKKKDVAADLHDCTYGITSDPLTQFAVILSALIHDVDHRGVPNNILSDEEPELAAVYHNKSVAEQNSVDIAWECLMDPRFVQLRKCIYGDSEAELKRFRVLLVNCVMSTDIFDKELSSLRKARWQKAFSVPDEDAATEDINRKATIVVSIFSGGTAPMLALLAICIFFCSQLIDPFPGLSCLTILFCRSSISSKHLMYHTPCSIGMCIRNGMKSSSRKCTLPTVLEDLTKTHLVDGTKGKILCVSRWWQ